MTKLEIIELEQKAFKAGVDYQKEYQDIFALGFAVWLHDQNLEFIDLTSVQQLLSNYKKEKRL